LAGNNTGKEKKLPQLRRLLLFGESSGIIMV